jgi:hypothetical protein
MDSGAPLLLLHFETQSGLAVTTDFIHGASLSDVPDGAGVLPSHLFRLV